MPSLLSNNQSQATETRNPMQIVNDLVNQIMSSANPQQTFNQVLQSSPDAKNAMDLINQYGNGDPKAAFANYAAATGKQSLGQTILQNLGLR